MRKSNKIRLKKRLETVFKCVSIRLKMMVALRILKSFSRYTFIYSGALHFLQCIFEYAEKKVYTIFFAIFTYFALIYIIYVYNAKIVDLLIVQ
jgi:hypothetical protein